MRKLAEIYMFLLLEMGYRRSKNWDPKKVRASSNSRDVYYNRGTLQIGAIKLNQHVEKETFSIKILVSERLRNRVPSKEHQVKGEC